MVGRERKDVSSKVKSTNVEPLRALANRVRSQFELQQTGSPLHPLVVSSVSGGVEDSQELEISEENEDQSSIPGLPVRSFAATSEGIARNSSDSQEGEVELFGSFRDMQDFIMELFPEARGPVVQAKRCSSGQASRFVRGMSEETSPSSLPQWNLHEIVESAGDITNDRAIDKVLDGKPAIPLSALISRKKYFAVSGPSCSSQPVNENLCNVLPSSSKSLKAQLGISVDECSRVEGALGSMTEKVNSLGWVWSANNALVSIPGLIDDNLKLYHKMVNSFNTTLKQLMLEMFNLKFFLAAKRRDFYLSHVPSTLSDLNKKKLRASSFLGKDLFDEVVLEKALDDSNLEVKRRCDQALLSHVFKQSENINYLLQ